MNINILLSTLCHYNNVGRKSSMTFQSYRRLCRCLFTPYNLIFLIQIRNLISIWLVDKDLNYSQQNHIIEFKAYENLIVHCSVVIQSHYHGSPWDSSLAFKLIVGALTCGQLDATSHPITYCIDLTYRSNVEATSIPCWMFTHLDMLVKVSFLSLSKVYIQ